jgi:hypothetical protein
MIDQDMSIVRQCKSTRRHPWILSGTTPPQILLDLDTFTLKPDGPGSVEVPYIYENAL